MDKAENQYTPPKALHMLAVISGAYYFNIMYCTFPDLTTFKIAAVLESSNDQLLIQYFFEEIPQVIWVPKNFVHS